MGKPKATREDLCATVPVNFRMGANSDPAQRFPGPSFGSILLQADSSNSVRYFEASAADFALKFCLCCFIKFRRRRCAGCDRHTYLQEEFLLTGRRTDAKHPHRLGGRIVKLMRRICWDVDRLTRAYHLFGATKSNVEFAFKNGERLFEVVTVRGRCATGRYMHVDQAKPARRVFGGEKDCVDRYLLPLQCERFSGRCWVVQSQVYAAGCQVG
jgi:hypothetical protein